MRVNGTTYFASKPDLLVEDLSVIPGATLYIYGNSTGTLTIGCEWHDDEAGTKPISILLSPTETQKGFTKRFLEVYRGAKVLPNGDLEFILQPRKPA